uniref:Uncharacterized protein n=1 Tax=Eutreptiella gymnastica TaxID=73025 RepID=A0A6T1Z0R8_9EUGL
MLRCIHRAMHEARCGNNITLKFISLEFIRCTIANNTTKVLVTQPIAESHNVLDHLLCCCSLGCGFLVGQNGTTNGGTCTSLLRLEMSGIHLEVPPILACTITAFAYNKMRWVFILGLCHQASYTHL